MAATAAAGAVGKRTLVEASYPPVQRRAEGAAPAGPETVKAAAAHGTSGAAGPLPHLDRIQQLFGPHNVTGVRAYVGGPAAEGAARMGAEAFATGDQVAFGAAPDLHTAAHEAAHVVQQRQGVQLKGGVGEVGDAYERQADEVADRVVQGRPAGDLLGQPAGAAANPGIQAKFRADGKPLSTEAAQQRIDRMRLTTAQCDELTRLNIAPHPEYDLDEEVQRLVAGAPGDPMWLLGQLRQWYGDLPVILQQSLEEAAGQGTPAMIRVIEQWMAQHVTEKQVGGKAAARLQAAHMAIATVKRKLAAGAGNQLMAVAASGGNASARATLAKPMVSSDKGTRSSDVARAAEIAQSGSCREYASLLYHELLALGVAPLRIVRSKGIDHTFVLIGSFELEALADCVAADAWPSVTQACLLEDHFTFQGQLVDGSVTPHHGAPQINPIKTKSALASALCGTGIDIHKLTFAPAATQGLGQIRYMFDDEPVIAGAVLQRDPAPQVPSQEAELARLTELGYGASASGGQGASSSVAGSSGPSSAIDVKAEILKIQESWEEHMNDDRAAGELAALARRAGEGARELILEGARQIDADVKEKVEKLLS